MSHPCCNSGRTEPEEVRNGDESSAVSAGASIPEFLQQFGTEAQCEAALQAARWPHGIVLPEMRVPAPAAAHRGEVAVFAAAHIATSATVVTDGLWCFRATTLMGATHQRVLTGAGRASVELPQFKAINTLGNLKTAITGTYQAFDFAKYAHRYLAEFQYRFDRRFNMRAILRRLLSALVAAHAALERSLRLAELSR